MVVYRHRRLDTYEVFYIGIGKKEKRAYSKYNRNKHWHNIVNKVGYIVEILYEVDTWEEACELEMLLISEYGRKDLGLGNLVNRTDGGDGCLGAKCSKETRQKLSNSMRGKKHTEETKQKISKSIKNTINSLVKTTTDDFKQKISQNRKGKHHTEDSKQKMSIANRGINSNRSVLTEEQVYEIKYCNFNSNQEEIAFIYGVSKANVSNIRNSRRWKHI